jgi:hypothetical protein
VRTAVESDPASRIGFIDVYYPELLADPIAAVRRIYQAFDLPLPAATVDRMSAYLEHNRQHRHGVHSYALEQFALDPEATRARFGRYLSHFAVAGIEPSRSR